MLMDVVEHLLRVVREVSCNIDVSIKVHSEDSLELPQREDNRTLCIVNVRDGLLDCRLCPHQFELGNLLGVVLFLNLLEVVHGVFIHALVDLECLLCKKDRKIGVLHLSHSLQTGAACLLHCKFHIHS